MNYKMISKFLGRLLFLEALLLLIPIAVTFIYKEPWLNTQAFLITVVLLLVVSFFLTRPKSEVSTFYAKEGFVIVSLAWILMSFFGGLPLFFSGHYSSFIDTFFEISSGFTTTGASVISNIEALPHSILFWRSFTHLIGGMGVLVLALALLPQNDNDSIHLLKAEVPGPTFGKIVSKLGTTARILYTIYLIFTAVLILLLILGGMPVFDSILHAFGTAGTGGFGIKNTSVGYYDSAYLEMVISVGMLVFGVNFNLYYLILAKKTKDVLKSEELKWYLGIVALAIILIMGNLTIHYQSVSHNFRHVFFQVSSIITTTGYSTIDFNSWPLFSHIILLLLMFIGGMAGSTAGGIKVSRIGIITKSALAELKRTHNPKRVVKVIFDNKTIESNHLRVIANYIFLYILCFSVLLLIVSFDVNDFISAFSAVAATFNNIGPGLGVVGPASSFGGLNDVSKFFLSFGMIAGRLEILPMLILFSPRTWRKT